MTTAFKVGDKVELLMDYMFAKKGDTLTVVNPNKYGTSVHTTHDATGKELGGFTHRFKLVEAPAHEFKVGDKVKTIGTDWTGRTGKVTETKAERPMSIWPYVVTFGNGEHGIYSSHELELIPEEKPFTFKDIQKGDKIRRTRTYRSGAVEIREGIATNPEMRAFWSDGSVILAYQTDDTPKSKGTITLELLERPEPPKAPEPWENAKTGDVLFRVDKVDGARDTFIKKADGGWTIFYADGSTEYQISAEEKLSAYFLDAECVAPQLA